METIYVILWPFRKSSKWYHTLVSRLICFFTNGFYTHTAVSIGDSMYESTVMNNQNGIMKGNLPNKSRGCVYLTFKTPLKNEEITTLSFWANQKVVEKRPYNFMKIFVLMFVYPTKRFWNWLGWVPFQNEVYGSVCSVFIDELFKQVGIDLLPKQNEEYTSPSDFLESKLLEVR